MRLIICIMIEINSELRISVLYLRSGKLGLQNINCRRRPIHKRYGKRKLNERRV